MPDCADPGPLAEFWAAILGGEVVFTTATSVGVRTVWTWIAATAVPDYQPPTWPEAGVPSRSTWISRSATWMRP